MDMHEMHRDMVMMQNGKVMVMRNGETTLMEEEMTMADGIKIMPNGQVLMTDGTAWMMQEGETMMMQGEPAGAENMTDRQFTERMEDEELRDDMHETIMSVCNPPEHLPQVDFLTRPLPAH